jgi:hypothetical protein
VSVMEEFGIMRSAALALMSLFQPLATYHMYSNTHFTGIHCTRSRKSSRAGSGSESGEGVHRMPFMPSLKCSRRQCFGVHVGLAVLATTLADA